VGCWQKDLLAEKGEASGRSPCGRVAVIIVSASHISARVSGAGERSLRKVAPLTADTEVIIELSLGAL
jgi:hypothetical protein